MDFRMFILDDSCEYSDFNMQMQSICFNVVCRYSRMMEQLDSEQYFYALMKEVLTSDWIVVNARSGLSFADGSILMLAKLYKIPVYLYGKAEPENYKEKYFCEELCTRCFPTVAGLISYLNSVYCNNKLQIIHNKINPEDALLKMDAFDAGYDMGYAETQGFWGSRPANYVQMAADFLKDRNDITCIDLGCGTGKNALYLHSQGFSVEAVDSSYFAIVQAKALSTDIVWRTRDVRKWNFKGKYYDIVVMTGLLHCYSTKEEIIQTVKTAKEATKPDGYNVLSVFNDEQQDLSGHPADFTPILLPHQFYMDLYQDWTIIASSNMVLDDEHPNNNIKHKHSITRILAQKR